jgi:dual specificity tyrosine-phosphorylation-regulated kinase 2/3/4
VNVVDEDEIAGDEEMLHYIKRQQNRRMANGASQKEVEEMLKFPEPIPPKEGQTPQGELLPLFSVL